MRVCGGRRASEVNVRWWQLKVHASAGMLGLRVSVAADLLSVVR